MRSPFPVKGKAYKQQFITHFSAAKRGAQTKNRLKITGSVAAERGYGENLNLFGTKNKTHFLNYL